MKTTSPGMHDHEDTFFAHNVFDPLETKVNPGSVNSFLWLSSTLPFQKKRFRKSYLEQDPVLLCLDKNHAFRYTVEETVMTLIRFVSHTELRNLD